MQDHNAIKIFKLQQAVTMLTEAQKLVRSALGSSDSSDFTTHEIQNVIEDLNADILDLHEE